MIQVAEKFMKDKKMKATSKALYEARDEVAQAMKVTYHEDKRIVRKENEKKAKGTSKGRGRKGKTKPAAAKQVAAPSSGNKRRALSKQNDCWRVNPH